MSDATLESQSCTVETSTEFPFAILSASSTWCQTWGYKESEAIGKSISILNGEGYDSKASAELMEQFRRLGRSATRCTNSTKDGKLLEHDAILTQQPGSIRCISSNFSPTHRSVESLIPSSQARLPGPAEALSKDDVIGPDDMWSWHVGSEVLVESELQSTGQTVTLPRASSTEDALAHHASKAFGLHGP